MSLTKLSLMPRTTDDSATTTNTPTATPMIVSAARTRFALIASSAMVTPSRACSTFPPIVIPMSSLLAQSLDGIQPRGATGRIHAGDDADDGAQ